MISGFVLDGLRHLKINRGKEEISGNRSRRALFFPLYHADKLEFIGPVFAETTIHIGRRIFTLNKENAEYTVPNYQWSGILKKRSKRAIFRKKPDFSGFRYLYPAFRVVASKDITFMWMNTAQQNEPTLIINKKKFSNELIKKVRTEPGFAIYSAKVSLTDLDFKENGKVQWQINEYYPLTFEVIETEQWEKTWKITFTDLQKLTGENYLLQLNELYNNSFFFLVRKSLLEKSKQSGNELFVILLERIEQQVKVPFSLVEEIK
ncbi:hypothetical protein ACFL35_15725 [Candidatus Riflebacteria bacterium]